MLSIDDRQLRIMAGSSFPPRLAVVIAKHFPAPAAAFGLGLTGKVEAGIGRARAHGFEAETDLSKYVMLEFALHPAFDCDPAMPWAAELLAAKDIPTPAMRMVLLVEAACDALRPSSATPAAEAAG